MRHCTCSLPCILRAMVAVVFIFFSSHFGKPVTLCLLSLLSCWRLGRTLVSMLHVHIKTGSQSHMLANLSAQLHRVENGQKKKKPTKKLQTWVCPKFLFLFFTTLPQFSLSVSFCIQSVARFWLQSRIFYYFYIPTFYYDF